LFGAVYGGAIDYFGHPYQVVFYTSALFGVLGVLATFLLGFQLRSAVTGLVAAPLIAACRMHVAFSRSRYPVATQTVLIAAGTSLVLRARRTRALDLTGMIDAGIPFGLAQLCYLPSYASLGGVAVALLATGVSEEQSATKGIVRAASLLIGAVGAYLAG